MKRINITNGINLTVISTDKFKSNVMSVMLALPLKEETASYAALLPRVLKNGTKSFPTMLALNRHLENLYACSLSGKTLNISDNQVLSFRAAFLRDDLIPEDLSLTKEVCSLLSEYIFEPYFENGLLKKEYVESEKVNLCDAIRAEINDKRVYARKKLFEIMCKGEPLSVSAIGKCENVEKITPTSLTEFYKTEFSKCPVEIFFVGNCNENELIQTVKESFAKYKRASVPYAVPFVREDAENVRREVEEMSVNQGKLAMGFRTGASNSKKNTSIFRVFNEIFGASPTSKLFMNVREKLHLCYYCSSAFIAANGIMHISSGVKVGDEKKAEDEILSQLLEMQKGNFSDKDIIEAKTSIRSNYMSSKDDPDSITAFHYAQIVRGEEIEEIEETIRKCESVTKEQIVEIANTVKLDTVYFLKGTKLDEQNGESEE